MNDAQRLELNTNIMSGFQKAVYEEMKPWSHEFGPELLTDVTEAMISYLSFFAFGAEIPESEIDNYCDVVCKMMKRKIKELNKNKSRIEENIINRK